jgi:NitT/TauT family transport system ATP-binding protein
MLAASRYVGAPAPLLQAALANRMPLAPGSRPVSLPDFYVPARHSATFPWMSHALWFYAQMVRWRQVGESPANLAAARATYRPEFYRRALASLAPDIPTSDLKPEHFFDEATFDPQ